MTWKKGREEVSMTELSPTSSTGSEVSTKARKILRMIIQKINFTISSVIGSKMVTVSLIGLTIIKISSVYPPSWTLVYHPRADAARKNFTKRLGISSPSKKRFLWTSRKQQIPTPKGRTPSSKRVSQSTKNPLWKNGKERNPNCVVCTLQRTNPLV